MDNICPGGWENRSVDRFGFRRDKRFWTNFFLFSFTLCCTGSAFASPSPIPHTHPCPPRVPCCPCCCVIPRSSPDHAGPGLRRLLLSPGRLHTHSQHKNLWKSFNKKPPGHVLPLTWSSGSRTTLGDCLLIQPPPTHISPPLAAVLSASGTLPPHPDTTYTPFVRAVPGRNRLSNNNGLGRKHQPQNRRQSSWTLVPTGRVWPCEIIFPWIRSPDIVAGNATRNMKMNLKKPTDTELAPKHSPRRGKAPTSSPRCALVSQPSSPWRSSTYLPAPCSMRGQLWLDFSAAS
jgi:hypothetical protein